MIDHPSFGRIPQDRVIIFDTTLRDGEQSPGFSMNADEKVRMAAALARLGVDVLEAGFPAASPDDFEAVRRIAEIADGPVICGLGRATERDIAACADALKPAKRRRIHTFISTSAVHMRHKLRMAPETVLDAVARSVAFARRHCDDVEWSAEDASRTDPDFLCRAVEIAIRAGATTVNLPDTVGYATPQDIAAMFAGVRERVPGADDVILSTHNHNDLGLAVANALSAVTAGVRQVECTVNGIGERAGNAALEEIVMALRTRRDAFPYATGVETTRILKTARLLAAITGFDVQPNKAIVGRNAFAHESGIHQDGMLKHARTYEIMTPESVGWTASNLVLGKHSGRAAFREKLKTVGLESLNDADVDRAFAAFKIVADRKKVVYEDDVLAIVDEVLAGARDEVRLVSVEARTGSTIEPQATLELEVGGVVRVASATGDGAVDAAFKAIRQIQPHTAELVLFNIQAVTAGGDAQARTTVRLEQDGLIVDGQGADTDTVVSAARAYVHALNKLVAKQRRADPLRATA
jgi:2-isopropylmalate synthase